MEVLVKYSNRKIYSRKINKYVNNSYIVDLVKTGESFEVREHKTDKNITGTVLASCISDLSIGSAKLATFIKENV